MKYVSRVYFRDTAKCDGPLNLGEISEDMLNVWCSVRLIHHTTDDGAIWTIPFSAIDHINSTPVNVEETVTA